MRARVVIAACPEAVFQIVPAVAFLFVETQLRWCEGLNTDQAPA